MKYFQFTWKNVLLKDGSSSNDLAADILQEISEGGRVINEYELGINVINTNSDMTVAIEQRCNEEYEIIFGGEKWKTRMELKQRLIRALQDQQR